MPIALRARPKAMRGKCERGHSFSTPGLRFHGVDRADVFNNIRVRASRCGECALNPLTSHPIPRRRPSPAPAQRHALPEHSRSPTQRRYTPADLTTPSPPKAFARPRTATRPPRALPLPHAAPMHARRLRDAIPAELTTRSHAAPPCPPFRSASGTKKRHRTVHVRCRMSRSTVVAVGHLGW